MAELDVDRKDEKENNKKNTNWWIWAVVAIIVIVVAWIALDNRTDVQREEAPAVDTTTLIEGSGSNNDHLLAFTRLHSRK